MEAIKNTALSFLKDINDIIANDDINIYSFSRKGASTTIGYIENNEVKSMTIMFSNKNIKPKMSLKEREQEVLRLKNEGFSQTQIADKLFVSQKTISNILKPFKDK